jgi:hypothetical protein
MLIALELRVMLHDLFRSVGLAISLIPNGLTKIATGKSAQRIDSTILARFSELVSHWRTAAIAIATDVLCSLIH